MSIKKSSLEQKWYYRLAKVFFLILPLLVIFIILLNLSNGKITICGVLQNNILNFLQKYLAQITIGLVSYYLILKLIWSIFLYIVFGGLIDDTEKKSDVQPTPTESQSIKIIRLISIIIILSAITIVVLSKTGYLTSPKVNIGSFGNSNVETTTNPIVKPTCFTTSAQMATPCHSVKNGVGVSGVIVPAICNCPDDTKYAQMDNITAGGPYKICTCN